MARRHKEPRDGAHQRRWGRVACCGVLAWRGCQVATQGKQETEEGEHAVQPPRVADTAHGPTAAAAAAATAAAAAAAATAGGVCGVDVLEKQALGASAALEQRRQRREERSDHRLRGRRRVGRVPLEQAQQEAEEVRRH